MRVFTILALASVAVAQDCGTMPLCGQGPQEILWPVDPVFPLVYNMSFHQCCPARDTERTEDCQTDSVTANYSRTITFPDPFSSTVTTLTGGELLLVTGAFFEQADSDTCCPSCACFGDPHCVDFFNREDKWVLCDARTVKSTASRVYCPITKSMCLDQVDHEGNSCEWAPDTSDVTNWQVVKDGSPCVPSNNSSPSSLTMYDAPGYNFVIEQGERGVIKKVSLTVAEGTYSLDAEDCLQGMGWETTVLGGTLGLEVITHGIDYIWHVLDETTGIFARVRCTGNDRPEGVKVHRINVEEIIDHDYARINTSSGFCSTGEISEKAGESENTRNIEDNDLCLNGEAKNDVGICRALFSSDQLAFSNVEACKEQFCSRYASPHFAFVDDCIEKINNDGFEEAFCQSCVGSSNTLATTECLRRIEDFGWEEAIEACESERDGFCLSSADELPDSLEECQGGVEMQFLSEDGVWETYKAFPEETPPCPDAVFAFVATIGLETCGVNLIFTQPVRFIQRNLPASCHLTSNRCTSVSGFNFDVEFIPTPTVIPPPDFCVLLNTTPTCDPDR